jgi:hypothetical protein
MDILYILANRSATNYRELRYSLRSVCQNMDHGKVIIVGGLPAWCQGVEHVDGRDDHGNRAINIQRKTLAALKSGKVGETFAMFCDDIYLVEPWTCNAIRYLGPMLDARGSKNSKYDSVFHWIAWTSSGQKKDHEGYYVYCDNRAGTLAYIFEAACFVAGTVWYIWAR